MTGLLVICGAASHAQNTVLSVGHTDIAVSFEHNAWTLNVGYDVTGQDFAAGDVLLRVNPLAQTSVPGGVAFNFLGTAGSPVWILPQNQNPSLLYLGVNSERIPSGVFTGPLTIQLKRWVGPGYFMAWQAVGPGQYNIRVNTRDGIDTNDNFMPLIGSHEHFNWGFSTTGVYGATFQAFGQRIGETTNISSPESTFLFHILPLPTATNFVTWQKHFWPPGFNPPTPFTQGNPDGDAFANLLEYAFNLPPTNADDLTSGPLFSLVNTGGQSCGALAFTRYKPALDLNYIVEASGSLPGPWTALTNLFSVVANTNGLTDQAIVRDDIPTTTAPRRFYRLRVSLTP